MNGPKQTPCVRVEAKRSAQGLGSGRLGKLLQWLNRVGLENEGIAGGQASWIRVSQTGVKDGSTLGVCGSNLSALLIKKGRRRWQFKTADRHRTYCRIALMGVSFLNHL